MTAPSTTGPRRFEALDAWRGIAALAVALVHLTTESVLHRNAVIGNGTRFVDFFFVLSGFVIAHAYGQRLASRRDVVRFLIRRVGRLWPLHVTVIAALVALQVSLMVAAQLGIPIGGRSAFARYDLDQLPLNVLLIHAWGMYRSPTWNGVSWSISTELFAYLTFAALVPLTSRAGLRAAAIALMATAMVVLATVAPMGMKSMADFGLFRCLLGFMAGVLTQHAWVRWPRAWGTGGEIAAAALLVAAVALVPRGLATLAIVPVFAMVVFVFAAESGAVSRLLAHPAPRALGAWSYAIYLIHPLFTTLFLISARHQMIFIGGRATVAGPTWFVEGLTLAYLAAVIGVASLAYRYVERPGQRLFHRWADALT